MQVEILTPMADGLGRVWKAGHRYEVDDDRGARLVEVGYAKAILSDVEQAVELLSLHGAGLLVAEDTAAELVIAAKQAGLPMHRRAGRKPRG